MIGDNREGGVYPRGEVRCVQRRDSCVSQRRRTELDMQLLCCCCINQHKCLYSVPATEQQKRPWLCLIFNDNVPAAVRVCMYVCANHFKSDCFSNESQYKADPRKRISLNHTGPSNCTRATNKCSLIVFTFADQYGEVSWKLAN